MIDAKAEVPGLGPRKGVPRIAPQVDWSRLVLDDEHGFVLSRIDGRTSLGEICLLVPFPEGKTLEILRSLFARSVIDLPGVPRPTTPARAPITPPPQAPTTPPARAPTTPPARAPLTPPAPIAARPAPSPEPARSPPPRVEPARPAPMATARPQQPSPSPPPMAAPVSAATFDSGDTEAVDLAPELRTRIDEMLALVARADPAALLGVPVGADKKEIRRAYFRLSKEFHPDRYFKRQLGPYKKKLQLVFNALTEASDRLGSDGNSRA